MNKLYKGKVADEDEYVIGFLVGDNKIYQMCENEISKNCGLGTFGIVTETLEEVDLEEYLISLGRIFENKNDELLELKRENKVLNKALELVCDSYIGIDCISHCLMGKYTDEEYWAMSEEEIRNKTVGYFIKQAKESMKDANKT